jgi:hypothetical protein
MGIAEEGLDAEGLVKPVMLGELVPVVEADGFAYRLWKFAELTSDGPGGEDSFSIDRVLNDAEAGLSFVENQQTLAASGEQHEVSFPMAWRPAALPDQLSAQVGPCIAVAFRRLIGITEPLAVAQTRGIFAIRSAPCGLPADHCKRPR